MDQRVKRWSKLILFSSYSIIVALSIVSFVVRALSRSKDLATHSTYNFPFEKAFSHTGFEVHSTYRGSAAHTGVSRLTSIKPPLKEDWSLPGFNVGVTGGGLAEPAVDDSGIYVGSDSGFFYKFDHSGKMEWRYLDAIALGGIVGTASVDERSVYLTTPSGVLMSLDKRSGQLNWMNRYEGKLTGSPVLFEDSVYVTVTTHSAQAYVARVKRQNGEALWQTPKMGGASSSSPSIDRNLGAVFVGAEDRKLYSFKLTDGQTLWVRELDAGIQTTPVLVGNQVFVATRTGFVFAFDGGSGEPEWKSLLDGSSRTTISWEPLEDVILVGTDRGLLYALKRQTGKPKWVDKTDTTFSGLAGILVANQNSVRTPSNLIWTTCSDLILCGLSPKTGKIVSQHKLRGPLIGAPVAYKDAILFAESDGSLVKLSSTPE